MVPKVNTTDFAIAKHLKKYLNWIQEKTNLRDVYVIDAGHYYKDEIVLKLLGKPFQKLAFKV